MLVPMRSFVVSFVPKKLRRGAVDHNVALVCGALVLAAGLIAWSLRAGSSPVDPQPPVVSVSTAAHQAAVNYFHELSGVYAQLAASPPTTVREAAEAAKASDEKLRADFDARLKAVMRPAIGDEALDKPAAQTLFGEMARGFSKVR